MTVGARSRTRARPGRAHATLKNLTNPDPEQAGRAPVRVAEVPGHEHAGQQGVGRVEGAGRRRRRGRVRRRRARAQHPHRAPCRARAVGRPLDLSPPFGAGSRGDVHHSRPARVPAESCAPRPGRRAEGRRHCRAGAGARSACGVSRQNSTVRTPEALAGPRPSRAGQQRPLWRPWGRAGCRPARAPARRAGGGDPGRPRAARPPTIGQGHVGLLGQGHMHTRTQARHAGDGDPGRVRQLRQQRAARRVAPEHGRQLPHLRAALHLAGLRSRPTARSPRAATAGRAVAGARSAGAARGQVRIAGGGASARRGKRRRATPGAARQE
jgi:hypothetical protein